MTGIVGDRLQQLAFLQLHWSRMYKIKMPSDPGTRWEAIAKFGQHDVLNGWTAEELLDLIRSHYLIHKDKRPT